MRAVCLALAVGVLLSGACATSSPTLPPVPARAIAPRDTAGVLVVNESDVVKSGVRQLLLPRTTYLAAWTLSDARGWSGPLRAAAPGGCAVQWVASGEYTIHHDIRWGEFNTLAAANGGRVKVVGGTEAHVHVRLAPGELLVLLVKAKSVYGDAVDAQTDSTRIAGERAHPFLAGGFPASAQCPARMSLPTAGSVAYAK